LKLLFLDLEQDEEWLEEELQIPQLTQDKLNHNKDRTLEENLTLLQGLFNLSKLLDKDLIEFKPHPLVNSSHQAYPSKDPTLVE